MNLKLPMEVPILSPNIFPLISFSVVGTEADLESQNVKAIIDLDPTCAPSMFLNEAVKIETLSENIN